MRRMVALGLLVVVAMLVAACGGSSDGGDDDASIGDARKGQQIFETGGDAGIPCLTCHTRDGSALVGPSLLGIKGRAGNRVPGLSAEEYIRQSIVDPSAYLVDGYEDTMVKTFGESLSDEDINNLIAYLMTIE